MSKVVKFAALQLTKSWDLEENLAKAKKAIREAAQNGANVILPQELFAAPYFCKNKKRSISSSQKRQQIATLFRK